MVFYIPNGARVVFTTVLLFFVKFFRNFLLSSSDDFASLRVDAYFVTIILTGSRRHRLSLNTAKGLDFQNIYGVLYKKSFYDIVIISRVRLSAENDDENRKYRQVRHFEREKIAL